MTARARVLVLLCLILFAPVRRPLAHAGGFTVPDLGVRRTAMAAVIGRPDEPSAVYHNPAGLALLPGTHLYVSLGVSLPVSHFRLKPWDGSSNFISTPVQSDGYYPEVKPSSAYGVIPMIVASTNIIYDKLWAALSFYVPNAVGSEFSPDAVTRYHLIKAYAVAGYGGLSFAWRPHDKLAIGAGVSLIYVKAYAHRLIFPLLNGMDYSKLLGGNTDLTLDGSTMGVGWNFGMLVMPHPRVSFGLALISGGNVTVEGSVSVKPDENALLGGSGAVIQGGQSTGLVIPYTGLFGVNVDVHKYVEVGMEARYYYYTTFRNQHTDITGIPFLKSLDSPKNYDNSWQLAGGIRVHDVLKGMEFMAGMHYDSTPAPDNTVSLDSPTFNHYGLHTGMRYQYGEHWRFGLSYLHYWYLQRSTDGSLTIPPSNFVASGENHIITVSVEAMLSRGLTKR